jgi:hypothetical protein
VSQFRTAKKRVAVSVGESERIVRELQGLSWCSRVGKTIFDLRHNLLVQPTR